MGKKSYGKKISKQEADWHFDLLMKIKENTHETLKAHLKDEALRYYCGKESNLSSDLCFVFDKKSIRDLLEMLNEKDGADGLVIFNGVRSKEDSREMGSRKYTDIDGRPTLMIFPYKEASPPSATNDPDIIIMDEEGYEHPGTGGKPGGGFSIKDEHGHYILPSSFKFEEIEKYF